MALLKKTGDWVLIKQLIPVQIPIDPMAIYYALPTGNVFFRDENVINGYEMFAYTFSGLISEFGNKTPHEAIKSFVIDVLRKASKKNFKVDELNKFEKRVYSFVEYGNITLDDFESQVKIKTIFGDVVLQPHEYTICKDITPYLDAISDKSAVLRFLTNSNQLTGKLADQVFYLRARGIGYSEALQLCINNIKTQNLFYIEMTPPNAAYFCRNYLGYAKRKKEYVLKNNRVDLLVYPEYTLDDFIEHLEN